MPKYNVPNITNGIDEALVDVSHEIPTFIPMFLVFIYCMIVITGAYMQRKRMGSMDLPMWCTIAGIGTIMAALPLTLTSGIIELNTLGILVVITILSGFWLFMSRNRNEI